MHYFDEKHKVSDFVDCETDKVLAVIVDGRKWLDKVNGNTYHSARTEIHVEEKNGDRKTLYIHTPYQYGYGSSYNGSVKKQLKTELPMLFKGHSVNFESLSNLCARKNIIFFSTCKYDLKKWVKAWGSYTLAMQPSKMGQLKTNRTRRYELAEIW